MPNGAPHDCTCPICDRTREAVSGARFGYPGDICVTCYDRLDARVRGEPSVPAQLAAVRAVLAPLLDDPWEWGAWEELVTGGRPLLICRFCDAPKGHAHWPDCPVLRRDELLGR